MNGSPIASLVRAWVDTYTHGLPDEARAARCDEVEDDLWCQHEEARITGRAPGALAMEMLLRLVFGIPADVTWRLSVGGEVRRLERTPSPGDRTLGVLAIVAALSWGLAVLLLVIVGGRSVWGGTIGAVVGISSLVGGLAFAGAATGLALRLTDRISVFGAMGGVIAGMGALFAALGGYQADILLPIGSAVMAWEMGRIGLLSVRCATVHVASAGGAFVLLAMSLVDYELLAQATWLALLIVPYLVSWLLIGIWLLGGVPAPRGRYPAPDRPF